jgi:hypothetical protein
MPDPRARMKGLPNLGAAIDERIRVNTNRMVEQQTSTAPSVPLSQGGYPGGSGQGDEPVAPESWVVSLRAGGEAQALTGALVLAGDGDTTVAQAPAAPHFTITSPAYTATDGVERAGDEFHADTTVVRTSGDQGIAGIKSFSSFPKTPSAAPQLAYDAANKQYVDDQVATGQLWQRNSGVLSPKHGSDALELANHLKLVKGTASEAVIYTFVSSEDHPRYIVQVDGTCCWGDGSSFDTILMRLAAGVAGMDSGHAFRTGEFCEFSQRSSAPSTPGSGYSRLFHKDDTRAYSIEPGGVAHDLSVAHKQSFPAIGGSQGSLIQLTYAEAAFPAWAVLPPSFTANSTGSYTWPAGDGQARLTDAYAMFDWTSAAQGGGVTEGAQVALGAACRRYGATATIRARLRVNAPARFSAIYLSLNDAGSNNAASANLVGNLSANAWYDAVLSGVDTGGWDGHLRLVLTAQGTDTPTDAGVTQLCVESLSIEQWVK